MIAIVMRCADQCARESAVVPVVTNANIGRSPAKTLLSARLPVFGTVKKTACLHIRDIVNRRTLGLSHPGPAQRFLKPLHVLRPLKGIVPAYLANAHVRIDPLVGPQAVPRLGGAPEHRV